MTTTREVHGGSSAGDGLLVVLKRAVQVTKMTGVTVIMDGHLVVPKMGVSIVDDPELWAWHLRDECSYEKIEVGGPTVGDELPEGK